MQTQETKSERESVEMKENEEHKDREKGSESRGISELIPINPKRS